MHDPEKLVLRIHVMRQERTNLVCGEASFLEPQLWVKRGVCTPGDLNANERGDQGDCGRYHAYQRAVEMRADTAIAISLLRHSCVRHAFRSNANMTSCVTPFTRFRQHAPDLN